MASSTSIVLLTMLLSASASSAQPAPTDESGTSKNQAPSAAAEQHTTGSVRFGRILLESAGGAVGGVALFAVTLSSAQAMGAFNDVAILGGPRIFGMKAITFFATAAIDVAAGLGATVGAALGTSLFGDTPAWALSAAVAVGGALVACAVQVIQTTGGISGVPGPAFTAMSFATLALPVAGAVVGEELGLGLRQGSGGQVTVAPMFALRGASGLAVAGRF